MKKVLFIVFAIILMSHGISLAGISSKERDALITRRYPVQIKDVYLAYNGGFQIVMEEGYYGPEVPWNTMKYLMQHFNVKTPDGLAGKYIELGDDGSETWHSYNKVRGLEEKLKELVAWEIQGKKYTPPSQEEVMSVTVSQFAELKCPVYDSYYPSDVMVLLDKILGLHEDDSRVWIEKTDHVFAEEMIRRVNASGESVEMKEYGEKDVDFGIRCPARYFVVTNNETGEKLKVALCQTGFYCPK